MTVDLDTGSSVLAVPGGECGEKCGAPKIPLYATNQSKSAHPVQCSDERCHMCHNETFSGGCQFQTLYGDGSYFRGYLVEDTVSVGGKYAAKVAFGVATSLSPAPVYPIAGLIGFAYKEMACQPTCTLPLFDGLLRDGVVEHDVFSVCMERHSGGVLTLGGEDPIIKEKKLDLNWVDMNSTTPKTFYTVPVQSEVLFGNDKLMMEKDVEYGIVDTGTTLLLIPAGLFKQMKDSVHSDRHLCKKIPGLCGEKSWFEPFQCVYGIDLKTLSHLPTLSITIGRKKSTWTMEIPPEVYMLPVSHFQSSGVYMKPRSSIEPLSDGTVGYCIGIATTNPPMWQGIGVIFGDTIMANKYITVYDRENQRMGFADMKQYSCAETVKSDNPKASKLSTKGYVWFGISAVFVLSILSAITYFVVKKCMSHRQSTQGYREITG
mmetsp:Transcript_5286/g.9239  ORF Transcript_5286/g.9239 Transcript_5286/m.9239 type:complete len:432 (+) Transcript_5286:515-1810(+)